MCQNYSFNWNPWTDKWKNPESLKIGNNRAAKIAFIWSEYRMFPTKCRLALMNAQNTSSFTIKLYIWQYRSLIFYKTGISQCVYTHFNDIVFYAPSERICTERVKIRTVRYFEKISKSDNSPKSGRISQKMVPPGSLSQYLSNEYQCCGVSIES
jgi:hypothetical protein